MRLVSTLLLLLSSFPLYSQTAPAVRRTNTVQSVSLTNDSVVSLEDFQEVVRAIQRNLYSVNLEKYITDITRSVLGDQGYFKAEVQAVGTEVLNETTKTRTIAVTLRIREGEQYRLGKIAFTGDKTFSDTQLRHAFPLNDGDVMSDKKIHEGLEEMRALYASKGYLEFSAVPQIVADDASRTVSVTMDMGRGPRFTINGLTLDEGPLTAVEGMPLKGHPWPEDKAAKLQALAQSFTGTHDVTGFVDDVKKLLAEMFPGYTQIESLVGETMGGEQKLVTLNVTYPSDWPN